MSDADVEELRKRRLLELQRQLTEEQKRTNAQQELEMQQQALLRRFFSPEARRRLTNLKIVKPEFAKQLELQLIQLAQAGRVSLPITDEQLKNLLVRLQSNRREFKIRRI